MKKKKLTIDKENDDLPLFCTECGDVLDDFAVSDNAKDLKKVKENFDNCKKTGKFKGQNCSKLYISSNTEEFNDEDI